jgi:NADH-quinone oxidoreductase subunit F
VRTAWRLGASEVHVIYRRRREDMPAYKEEIEAAEEEGVIFHFLTNPTRVLGDGHVTGVECLKQTLGEFDRSGRRRPVPLSGSEFVIELDLVIPAIGQSTALDGLEGQVAVRRDGTLEVSEALGASRPGVFAAGDAVSGPATVVEAVAQGNAVARAVDRYLYSGQMPAEKLVVLPGYEVVQEAWNLEEYAEARRLDMPHLPLETRQGSFQEVDLGMDEQTIQEECKRCLRCDLEWLQKQNLAFEPVPEREAAALG